MLGLMRIVSQRMQHKHSVLVLGDSADSESLRHQGLFVLGSVQGTDNNSRTLGLRLRRAVEKVTSDQDQVIAWGWAPALAVSGLDCVHRVIAFIDAIDSQGQLEIEVDTVIPTTWTCGERLNSCRRCRASVTEPLVGIDAKTLVLEPNSVFKSLGLPSNSVLVPVVNDDAQWQEIVDLIVLLRSVGVDLNMVVSSKYCHYSSLYSALEGHGLTHLLRRVPAGLRMIDVVHAASFIWAPVSTQSGRTDGILDLLSASASGIPVAASTEHAITGVPTIGNRLGWVSSIAELCVWILDLVQDSSQVCEQALELATRVRTIASPARFVEGLQLRVR